MGLNCPILNHPLTNGGVLVEDEAVVKFIQKRIDFLPNELVCQFCKQQATQLYNKKLKRAIELKKQKSLLHGGSVSSLQTSKSSSASTTSEPSLAHRVSLQRIQLLGVPNDGNISNTALLNELNGCNINSIDKNNHNANPSEIVSIQTAEVLSVSDTSIVVSTSISNTHSILQENQKNQETFGKHPNVTVRKKTIKDYLTVKAPIQTVASQVITSHKTADDEDDAIRRLSQEPTTSKAANTNGSHLVTILDSGDDDISTSEEATRSTVINANKRRLVHAVDSDDDPLSSYAVNNGTRLPHIQPHPPKRKPASDNQNTLARDIMDNYIKDITGG